MVLCTFSLLKLDAKFLREEIADHKDASSVLSSDFIASIYVK